MPRFTKPQPYRDTSRPYEADAGLVYATHTVNVDDHLLEKGRAYLQADPLVQRIIAEYPHLFTRRQPS